MTQTTQSGLEIILGDSLCSVLGKVNKRGISYVIKQNKNLN